MPFLLTGPIELGDGDKTVDVMGYIPDEKTLGQVDVSILSRYYPNGAETVSGPFDAKEKTDFQVNGRQHVLKYEPEADTDWRIGRPRVDIVVRGMR
jgi:hypothetical protein